jgi:oligopeptide/dipeptide ABC transporter ATP-binding protein
MGAELLKVDDLTVSFATDEGRFVAVDDVSLHINRGEIVGLVGESGCGKSVCALSILRLIPSPPGKITSGKIVFNGSDLLALDIKAMRRIRGRAISMIFQEPLSALSPLQRIGQQLAEVLQLHSNMDKQRAMQIGREWLAKVRIPDPEQRMQAYPHELSGGMQQRVMIAMALMQDPALVIADEPTTALDVTIQAQIFNLIKKMRKEKTSILLITHDMGVVWQMCDRVLVMYASTIVESGTKAQIFEHPAHPYTRGLLQSIPTLFGSSKRLPAIAGYVPSPFNYPSGCHFRDRCPYAVDRCAAEGPKLENIENGGHQAACFVARKLVEGRLE